MQKKTRDYEKDLIERLKKDRDFAVAYINTSLEDVSVGYSQRLLMALRRVAQAWGISELASQTGISRQAIYRALSKNGNPELSSLYALLNAMGLRLVVEQKKAS